MIATVVNIAASLVKLGWSGFGITEVMWANIILIVALVIVFIVTHQTSNSIIPLPVAWAYFAIYKAENLIVALILVFTLILISAYQFYFNDFLIQKSLNR